MNEEGVGQRSVTNDCWLNSILAYIILNENLNTKTQCPLNREIKSNRMSHWRKLRSRKRRCHVPTEH